MQKKKSKGCNVSGGKQFTTAELSNTQEIARLRIHVERAIRRVKEYHFLDRVQPLVLGGSVNQGLECLLLSNKSKRATILRLQISFQIFLL